MRYRADIDGLRAIAVIPVILFHAGFKTFSGGFVGVDVFFVISGYLITSIILSEMDEGKFNLINFYERRVRRILPALFFVMSVSALVAYKWMLPDPLENFGQSLVATTLFANNILLIITAGYWDLAVEFKPLLHTWSLAIEEQYYILFPPFLMLTWKAGKKWILIILTGIALFSLGLAQWGAYNEPKATFFLFPTRGWEILFGSFVAFYLSKKYIQDSLLPVCQLCSLLGLSLIFLAVFAFDKDTPFPSLFTLVPTVGTVLVILFTQPSTIVYRILSNRLIVGVGLISYSAYLWHQPILSFARIYVINEPSKLLLSGLIVLAFVFAFFTWKYVESPFRNRGVTSRGFVFSSMFLMSVVLIFVGYLMHTTHGFPTRLYEADTASGSDMYISYNERAFNYKKESFNNTNVLKILILGNSSARDFVNMTLENFDTTKFEIVYREDFSDCLNLGTNSIFDSLYADADLIIFASGSAIKGCVIGDIKLAKNDGKEIYYIGTKHFGYNLNWLTRLDNNSRKNAKNPMLDEFIIKDRELEGTIPHSNYVSLLGPLIDDNGMVPITDELGRLISADRVHLTKHGAQYVGRLTLIDSYYGRRLINYQNQ